MGDRVGTLCDAHGVTPTKVPRHPHAGDRTGRRNAKLPAVRALPALLVLLTLAACGRADAPPLLDSRTPPALGPRFFPPEGWAWGALTVTGAPTVRYGVASPPVTPRADVVILPAYGESAEVYFETVRDLTAHGYGVWVLDAAGQGGSARFPGPSDLGRSKGFEVDAAALDDLVAEVIRPGPRGPLVVAAGGSAGLTALLCAETGRTPLDGLFLWSLPEQAPGNVARAHDMTRSHLGGLRAEGAVAWVRPTSDLSGRTTLAAAWQLADPDLRMGGPSWDWIAAEDDALRSALDPRVAPRLRPAVLALETAPSPRLRRLCAAAPQCRLDSPGPALSAARGPFAGDAARGAWLDALVGFVEMRIAQGAHPR